MIKKKNQGSTNPQVLFEDMSNLEKQDIKEPKKKPKKKKGNGNGKTQANPDTP